MEIPVWIDFLLGWVPGYKQFKTIIINAIILAELREEAPGNEKKEAALKAIIEALAELGLKLPIPEIWLKWIISVMIDAIVLALNTKFGHDWIKKLQPQE